MPDEHHAGRERHQHHLVRVPRDRPGPLDPLHPEPVRGREERGGPVGAVHVQPDPPRLAQLADRLEVVERAGGGRARRRDHRHDPPPPGLLPVQLGLERGHVHPEAPRRHGHRVLGAEAQLAHGPRHGVVRVLAVEHDRRHGADPLLPRVRQGRRPRREERGERGLGAARGERAARLGAEPGQVAHPADDPRLEDRAHRRHLPHRGRLVERGDERLRPDRGRQRRRDLVAHRARVAEVVRVGDHVAPQALEDVLDRSAGPRKRLLEPARQLVRAEGRRHAALAGARGREVLDRDPREGLGDRRLGVLLDVGKHGVAGGFHAGSGDGRRRQGRGREATRA